MRVELAYAPEMAEYRFAAAHPLRPERFTLAVDLARAWGLLGDGGAHVVGPAPATEPELLLVHDATYVAAVRRASSDPGGWREGYGIGPGDTPAFPRMHDAAALVVGGTVRGLRDVATGAAQRAFCPAGGLHHAHRDRAAGFCVYNDPAVAIAAVTAENPGLRIAYVDLDAHHGDGVQEAFYDRADVLTVSVHESGSYLYPGTGSLQETGLGEGTGFALNVPLPPDSGDACYSIVLEQLVAPALRAFEPDIVFAQLGDDSHRDDPLTHLDTTVAGQHANARALIASADELCDGRIVATGGGGYDAYSAAPRAWACVLAALSGFEPPSALPQAWRDTAERASGGGSAPPLGTFDERSPGPPTDAIERALAGTTDVMERLLGAHPLLQRRG